MELDPRVLAEKISAEIGLEFLCKKGMNPDGGCWFELWPADHPANQTFVLRVLLGWRRIDILFEPGKFSAHLMEQMGAADATGRRTFCAVLHACHRAGAEIRFSVNGVLVDPEDQDSWSMPWRRLGLEIRKGMLSLNEGDAAADAQLVELWASRGVAALAALLPVEEIVQEIGEAAGLPEGAKMRVEVNRYERDRRNRAAALAIHGYICQGCHVDMGQRYGDIAAGMIEVHHVTPVSQIGLGHIVDPRTDLVPLCPNCHAVTHRRSPPFSLVELRNFLIPFEN